MGLFAPIADFVSESEWCGRFRETLAVDPSVRGWLSASYDLVLGIVGRVLLACLALALLLYFVVFR